MGDLVLPHLNLSFGVHGRCLQEDRLTHSLQKLGLREARKLRNRLKYLSTCMLIYLVNRALSLGLIQLTVYFVTVSCCIIFQVADISMQTGVPSEYTRVILFQTDAWNQIPGAITVQGVCSWRQFCFFKVWRQFYHEQICEELFYFIFNIKHLKILCYMHFHRTTLLLFAVFRFLLIKGCGKKFGQIAMFFLHSLSIGICSLQS